MSITFDLSPDIETPLRSQGRDIAAEAKECFLVDLYRRGELSHFALSNALGLDRFETEEVLHKHNVTEDLGTLEDYLQDARELEKLRALRR